MRLSWVGAALVLAVGVAGCQHQTEAAPQDVVADGRDIAQAQCSSCHAIGVSGASARPEAPPLRVIASRYKLSALNEALMEGIKVGHPMMPKFQFSPRGADALIAYIHSIRADDKDINTPAPSR